MFRPYILTILTLLLLLSGRSDTYAQGSTDDLTLRPDSLWFDAITGRKMHLQRLGGIDTLVYVKPNALTALGKDLAINALVLSWDHFVQDRDWARVTASVIKDHFSNPPVFDDDSFSGNQFSHPYHGGMFYNAARNEGLSYGVSLLYPLIGSATWEYLCETNPPSINDLLSTGIGGAVIGEVTHRTSDIFFDNSKRGANRVVREIIGSALNPVRAVHRLISGEMWRVSPSRGKRVAPQPYSFEVGLGTRFMAELNGNKDKMRSSYIDFSFNYGERFNQSGRSKPFDLFHVDLLTNLSSKHPTVGNLDISGRLADRQLNVGDDWKLDIGFYQNLKYVEHYSKQDKSAGNFSIISEAVSFGGGIYAEHNDGLTCLSEDLMLSAVVFGGTNSDYYPNRRYSYASGFSVRNGLQMFINQKALIGHKLYFADLYSLKGYSPEELEERIEDGLSISCWGDQGNHLIINSETYIQYNLMKNVRFNLDYQYFYRRSYHKYNPAVKAKSHEFKFGLIYSI